MKKSFEIVMNTGKVITVSNVGNKKEASEKALNLKLLSKDDFFDVAEIRELNPNFPIKPENAE